MAVWGSQHSILASDFAKKKFGVAPLDKRYRIFFNSISVLTLLIVELIISNFLNPNGIHLTPLIDISLLHIQIAYYTLQYIGIIIAIGALIQINPLKILGVIQQKPNKLIKNGFYRFSRHPMYAGFLLILLAGLLISKNSVTIIKIIGYIIYLAIGAKIEERRLKKSFKNYDIMFTRGFLFPFRKKHFKVIFRRRPKTLTNRLKK